LKENVPNAGEFTIQTVGATSLSAIAGDIAQYAVLK